MVKEEHKDTIEKYLDFKEFCVEKQIFDIDEIFNLFSLQLKLEDLL